MRRRCTCSITPLYHKRIPQRVTLDYQHSNTTLKHRYASDGIDPSMMPSAKDNKPCIDLVERKPKKKGAASGILRHLSEFKDTPSGKKKPPHNNQILVKQWVKAFGMKRGEQKKSKERWMRASSKQFYGNRKHDEVFHIVHYAGDIEYVSIFLLRTFLLLQHKHSNVDTTQHIGLRRTRTNYRSN